MQKPLSEDVADNILRELDVNKDCRLNLMVSTGVNHLSTDSDAQDNKIVQKEFEDIVSYVAMGQYSGTLVKSHS